MRFSEFIGNKEAADRLRKQIINGKAFHAYIFDGAEGIGKRKLAYTFAQALMCKNSIDGEPCQICDACKKVVSGNHGDIHYITTDGSSIKDEQIEGLQEILFSKPFDGDRTVLIIDKADTMTVRAQNRLLKTLEEPVGGVTLILLTEKISELLPTITSRSIVIRLKPVEKEQIKEFLLRETETDELSAELAAAYSWGCPGKGKRLLDEEDFKARRARSIVSARAIVEKATLTEFMATLGEDISGKEAALEFMEMMSFWYKDLLFIANGMEKSYIVNQDHYEDLAEFCKKTNLKKICRILEKLEDTKYDIMMNVSINYALKNMYLEIN
ncbi:MAG: hypothetical protein E7228_00075 [Clostridiales bacterium]|nr:hypothetical protein [Clostridiales bacterium]